VFTCPVGILKKLLQVFLGTFLTSAGISHLGSNRLAFQAQVPTWLPLDPDFVVIASGVVEIVLGTALITTTFVFTKFRKKVGIIVASFFVLIFPGNLNQYLNGIDAFGLDTDLKRFIRLFFQPPLVVWSLWVSGVIWAKPITNW
jgi:uncharacterized membrane protein